MHWSGVQITVRQRQVCNRNSMGSSSLAAGVVLPEFASGCFEMAQIPPGRWCIGMLVHDVMAFTAIAIPSGNGHCVGPVQAFRWPNMDVGDRLAGSFMVLLSERRCCTISSELVHLAHVCQ